MSDEVFRHLYRQGLVSFLLGGDQLFPKGGLGTSQQGLTHRCQDTVDQVKVGQLGHETRDSGGAFVECSAQARLIGQHEVGCGLGISAKEVGSVAGDFVLAGDDDLTPGDDFSACFGAGEYDAPGHLQAHGEFGLLLTPGHGLGQRVAQRLGPEQGVQNGLDQGGLAGLIGTSDDVQAILEGDRQVFMLTEVLHFKFGDHSLTSSHSNRWKL